MDFEQKLIDSMKYKNIVKHSLPGRDELLLYLHGLFMFTGRVGIEFCNNFLFEGIQLMINSIFLYEQGYFDCAFYSVRQASEVFDTMLYLSNSKEELENWNLKQFNKLDSHIKNKLDKMAEGYSEIKNELKDFFEYHRKLIKKSNKILHKQGFECFYMIRCEKKIDYTKEINLFLDTLKYTIGMCIIIYVILDPLSILYLDEDADRRLPFNYATERIDLDYFNDYLKLEDIKPKILESKFFLDFKKQFYCNEPMNDAVLNVVRFQFWDVECLNDIKDQLRFLSTFETCMYYILEKGIYVLNFYRCSGLIEYSTSYDRSFYRDDFMKSTFEQYTNNIHRFNQPYKNVYVSVITVFDEKIYIEHSSRLSDSEIEYLCSTEDNANKAFNLYKTIVNRRSNET